MKLYATITSERASRTVSKGGNDFLSIDIAIKNKDVMTIIVYPDSIKLLRLSENRRDEKGNPIVVSGELYHL